MEGTLLTGRVSINLLWSAEPFGVTAAPPTKTLVPLDLSRGTRIASVPAPLSMSLDDGPEAWLPTFGNVAACPDSTTAIGWRDRIRGYITSAPNSLHYHNAVDHLRKWIPEDGAAPGWYVQLPPPPDAEPFDPRIWAYLRERAGDPALYPRTLETVKPFTNHGSPTWLKSLLDHAIHILMAGDIQDAASATGVFERASAIVDLQDLPHNPISTLFSRTGPNRKATPIWEYVRGVITQVGTVTGLFTRRRHVKGVPTCVNEALRPDVMRLYRALKARNWWMNHSTPDETSLKVRNFLRGNADMRIWSDDISGFDDSVCFRHQQDLADGVLVHWLGAGLTDLYKHTSTMPLVSGPCAQGDRAYLWRRRGAILSGLITTTTEGTLINLACVISCVASSLYGGDVSAAITGHALGKWAALVQGDDTLLMAPKGLDPLRYAAAARRHGLTRELQDYPVFLMTWYGPGSSWHGLSSRAVMKTATREHDAPGPATELFGAAVRWHRCRNDPLFLEMWDLARGNPLFERFGVQTPGQLQSAAAEGAVVSMMETEIAGPQGSDRWGQLLEDLQRNYGQDIGPFAQVVARLGGLRALLKRRLTTEEILDAASTKEGAPWEPLLEQQVHRREARLPIMRALDALTELETRNAHDPGLIGRDDDD